MIPIRDNIPSRRVPFVNWMLIGLNCLVFLAQLRWMLTFPPDQVELMTLRGGLIPQAVFSPGILDHLYGNLTITDRMQFLGRSFFTHMFMHGGILHILFNMVSLFVFGDNVEDRLGHIPYLLFYLVGGIAAALMHVAANAGSTIPIIGASGAIAAVMGAYMLMFPRSQILTLVPFFCFIYFINIPAIIFLGFWFFLQFVTGVGALRNMEAQGVAWWAHIGGFLFGVVIAVMLGGRKRKGPPQYEPREPIRRVTVPIGSYRSRIDD